MDHQHDLNAEGLYCPEPVMMLHSKVAEMQVGEVLRVTATDPSTRRDIPKFCQMLGHTLVNSCEEESMFIYWIQKS